MRIHSNIVSEADIRTALADAKARGRIADHVRFKTLGSHRSATHSRAFEVQLEAGTRDRGRRAGNSGSYSAMRPEYDGYAATFDEWGWLLANLLDVDPAMVVGSVSRPVYAGRGDFTRKTALSYAPTTLQVAIAKDGDPYPYVYGNGARTKRGYMIGRFGANRVNVEQGEAHPRWYALRPRTIEQVREHAHLPNAEQVSA